MNGLLGRGWPIGRLWNLVLAAALTGLMSGYAGAAPNRSGPDDKDDLRGGGRTRAAQSNARPSPPATGDRGSDFRASPRDFRPAPSVSTPRPTLSAPSSPRIGSGAVGSSPAFSLPARARTLPNVAPKSAPALSTKGPPLSIRSEPPRDMPKPQPLDRGTVKFDTKTATTTESSSSRLGNADRSAGRNDSGTNRNDAAAAQLRTRALTGKSAGPDASATWKATNSSSPRMKSPIGPMLPSPPKPDAVDKTPDRKLTAADGTVKSGPPLTIKSDATAKSAATGPKGPLGGKVDAADVRKRLRDSPLPPATGPKVATGAKAAGTLDGPKLPAVAKPPVLAGSEKGVPAIAKSRTGAMDRPVTRPATEARFADRVKSGELDRVTKGAVAQQIKLADQYRLSQQGDVARRLQLDKHAAGAVHVNKTLSSVNVTHVNRISIANQAAVAHIYPQGRSYYHGWVSPAYTRGCFQHHYWGPHYFAGNWWYPHWHPWVRWSWYYHCNPFWDPRPLWCRPVIYTPAPVWVYYEVPVYVPLPVVAAGTWVDVPPVAVEQQNDLQLLAVRFVDLGHPEEKLGPRYRVWFRNNGDKPLMQPFNVVLLAGNGDKPADGLPQAGVRVRAIEAGDTQSVDVRLPIGVDTLGRDAQGNPAPLTNLHVLLDADREVNDANRLNNGTRLAREDVLPVDPATFEADPREVPAGGELVLAGEGFGPAPGQVLVHLGGLELEGEILGWYDLGVRVNLPKVPLAGPNEAEVIVVRGDGAAANPVKITVTPPLLAAPVAEQ